MAHLSKSKPILCYAFPFPGAFPAASATGALSARKNAGVRLVVRMAVSAVGFLAVVTAGAFAEGGIFPALLPPKCRGSISATDPAGPLSVWTYGQICSGIRMPLWAMHFARIFRTEAFSSQDILSRRDRFKVSGIDAGAIPAQMIDMLAGFKGANKEEMCCPAGACMLPIQGKLAIAASAERPRPIPAPGCLVNDHSGEEISPALSLCFLVCHIHSISENGGF